MLNATYSVRAVFNYALKVYIAQYSGDVDNHIHIEKAISIFETYNLIISFCYFREKPTIWNEHQPDMLHLCVLLVIINFFFILGSVDQTTKEMKELKWNIKTCWSNHHYHRFYVSLSLIIDILRATEQQPNMLAGNIISLYLVARFYYALLVSSVFFSSHMKSIGMRSFYEMYAHWKEAKRMNGNTRLTEIADFMQKFQHDMKWSFDSRPRKTQILWSFSTWSLRKIIDQKLQIFHYFSKKDNCPAK